MMYRPPPQWHAHLARDSHGRDARATSESRMTGIPALLLLGALAALANLAGGLLLASSGAHRRETRLLKYLIALGAGFMLAAIFIEMLPESVSLWELKMIEASNAEVAVIPMTLLLGGYLLIQ